MDFFIFISEQWLLVSVLLVLIYIFALTERSRAGKPVSPRELTSLLNSDAAVLLDIRDQKEFKNGHIVGAIHIPFAKLKDSLAQLAPHKEKIIVVACKMGQQAGAAGRLLRQQDYEVRRLAGGMMEWRNQNLPVVKGKD